MAYYVINANVSHFHGYNFGSTRYKKHSNAGEQIQFSGFPTSVLEFGLINGLYHLAMIFSQSPNCRRLFCHSFKCMIFLVKSRMNTIWPRECFLFHREIRLDSKIYCTSLLIQIQSPVRRFNDAMIYFYSTISKNNTTLVTLYTVHVAHLHETKRWVQMCKQFIATNLDHLKRPK